jgi:hypothetical protein
MADLQWWDADLRLARMLRRIKANGKAETDIWAPARFRAVTSRS